MKRIYWRVSNYSNPPKMGKVWKGSIHHYFRFGFHQILCFLGLLEPEWMLCYLWFLNMTSYKWPSNRMFSFVQLRFWAAWVYRFAPSSFILGGVALENWLVVSNIFRFPNIADDDSIWFSCLWDGSKHRRNRNWPEQDLPLQLLRQIWSSFPTAVLLRVQAAVEVALEGSERSAGRFAAWQHIWQQRVLARVSFWHLERWRAVVWNRTQKDRMIELRYERNWALGGMFPGTIFCFITVWSWEHLMSTRKREPFLHFVLMCLSRLGGIIKAAASSFFDGTGLLRANKIEGERREVLNYILHHHPLW